MISEYALEPRTLVDQAEGAPFLFRDFSDHPGRILSQYPRRWGRMVWQAFDESRHAADAGNRKRIEELLARIQRQSVRRPGGLMDLDAWLVNTEAEHERRTFRAILAQANPRNLDHVLSLGQLLNEECPSWNCPRDLSILPTADTIARTMASLLECSREVILVDPYFSARNNYREVLKAIAGTIWSERALHDCTLQIVANPGGPSNTDGRDRIINHVKSAMERSFPSRLPRGKRVSVRFCHARENGKPFHDRYVLTNIAGVQFGQGLAEDLNPESQARRNLHLMETPMVQELWRDFVAGDPPAYETDLTFTIEGTRGA